MDQHCKGEKCRTNECIMWYNHGWLRDEVSYNKVRGALRSVPVYFKAGTAEGVVKDFENSVNALRWVQDYVTGRTGKGAVVYMSNVKENDKNWLDHMKTLIGSRTNVTIVQSRFMAVHEGGAWSWKISCKDQNRNEKDQGFLSHFNGLTTISP